MTKNPWKQFSVENLIVFTLYSFGKKNESRFEELAEQCFRRFPKVFALRGYPKLLDARKLDRPLRDLRKKGLIKGNPVSCFSLTAAGKKRGRELARIFFQKKLL